MTIDSLTAKATAANYTLEPIQQMVACVGALRCSQFAANGFTDLVLGRTGAAAYVAQFYMVAIQFESA